MIATPVGALRAVGNIRDRVLDGPLADLRRMPRTAIDTGPALPDAQAIGRAHGLARAGSVSTYRYAVHPTSRLRGSPVLLVPPLGACGVAFDLRRGNSLVEHLVGEGRYVHQVDDEDLVGHGGTITASPADLQRWVDEILPHVVRTISAHHDGAPVHVVGWSIGGLLSVLAAAGHPDLPVGSVTAVATPFALDLVPPVVTARPLAVATGGPLLATLQTVLGLLPVPWLLRSLGFGALDELLTAPLTVLSRLDDRDFLAQLEAVDDLRALIGDQARLVGTFLRQMVDPDDLAAGRVPVGHRVVDLTRLRGSVLLVAGESDVVAPPRAVRAGAGILAAAETRITTTPGGHVGVVCGRAAKATTWARLCAFLDAHDAPETLDEARTPRERRATRRSLPAPAALEPVAPPPNRPGRGTDATPGADDTGPRDDEAPRGRRPGRQDDTPGTTTASSTPARRSSRLPAPKRATRTRGQE